jgi:F-type H+-transporting ATPase subunit b
VRIDWWTLGLQAINAIVLIWLLSRFLFKPVAAMIAERQAAAERIGAEAEALRASAQQDRDAAAAAEAEMAASRAAQLKAATDAAAGERERLVTAAHDEAARLRAAAVAEIERMRTDVERRAQSRASELAIIIAGRVLAHLPEALRIAPFLPSLGKAIDALSPQAKAGLAEQPCARVAAPLDETDIRALRVLLAEKLGAPAEPEIVVDAALIAGIELEGAHAVVRNSLRADLDHITAELGRDGD